MVNTQPCPEWKDLSEPGESIGDCEDSYTYTFPILDSISITIGEFYFYNSFNREQKKKTALSMLARSNAMLPQMQAGSRFCHEICASTILIATSFLSNHINDIAGTLARACEILW